MYVLGITGGIGAGKSTVLDELEQKYRACILRADEIGHQVMEPGEVCHEAVCRLLGRDVCAPDGRIDRKKASAILFADPAKLERMNRIIHPAVQQRILQTLSAQESNGCAFAAVEAALLLQAGYQDFCDEIWVVWCDRESRIRRLMESRGYSREKCLDILSAQPSDDWYRSRADFVLNNSGSAAETTARIRERLRGKPFFPPAPDEPDDPRIQREGGF